MNERVLCWYCLKECCVDLFFDRENSHHHHLILFFKLAAIRERLYITIIASLLQEALGSRKFVIFNWKP